MGWSHDYGGCEREVYSDWGLNAVELDFIWATWTNVLIKLLVPG